MKLNQIPYLKMISIVALVTALDAITTYLILSNGGYEANSWVAPFYPNPFLLVLLKSFYVAIVYIMIYLAEKVVKEGGWTLVLISVVITGIVVISNTVQLIMRFLI